MAVAGGLTAFREVDLACGADGLRARRASAGQEMAVSPTRACGEPVHHVDAGLADGARRGASSAEDLADRCCFERDHNAASVAPQAQA